MVPQLAEMDQNYQILELQTGGTAYSLLTGCLNAFTSLFFPRFLIWIVFSRVIIQFEILDRKYNSKDSFCFSVPFKHFPRL